MKKLFQKWLLIFVTGAFLITFSLSWLLHSHLAQQAAEELLRANLEEVSGRVRGTCRNLETIVEMSNQAALVKARALAHIIAKNPSILQDHIALESIRQKLNVDELHVSDADGVLIASLAYTPHGEGIQSYKGFDMSSTEQSAAFIPAITDPEFELVQAPQPNGVLNILFQYAGVARLDTPGIVQIGYRPERIEEAEKMADVNAIASSTRIGHHGTLTITPLSQDTAAGERVFNTTINGVDGLAISVPCEQYTLTAFLPEEELYLSRNAVLRILIIGNIILFSVIFILVSKLLQKIVITGIYSVNSKLSKIANGNLNERIDVTTTTEFADLSEGINTTVNALKRAIENETMRINAELEMGRTIQTSVLPVDFPNTPQYSIAALMHTAREVGGDFYDFFTLEDGRIAVVIADVSGKGITAALYMMNAKTLIKDCIQRNHLPSEAIEKANNELCLNNKANMFLTAFLAVLDPLTGELTCVNAGHNPPLLKRANGQIEFIKIKPTLVLGAVEMMPYTAETIRLEKGDSLLLYTDGITEATNQQNALYGEARLQEVLQQCTGAPMQQLNTIRKDVADFAGSTPQSDDITMLLLQYKNNA